MLKSKSDKMRVFWPWFTHHKCRNLKAIASHSPNFDSLPRAVFLIFTSGWALPCLVGVTIFLLPQVKFVIHTMYTKWTTVLKKCTKVQNSESQLARLCLRLLKPPSSLTKMENPKLVIWQIVKTQIKCHRMSSIFAKITVFQGLKYNLIWKF